MRTLFLLSLVVSSTDAFTASIKTPTSNFMIRSKMIGNYQYGNLVSLKKMASSPAVDDDAAADDDGGGTGIKLPSMPDIPEVPDIETIQARFKATVKNTFEGELGQRGEAYFLAQALLVICILIGDVPYIGDVLSFLIGPGLLLAGAATIVSAVGELSSTDGISPWPTALDKAELVDTGAYGYVRHPMYAGLLATMMGFSVLTGSATRVLLTFGLYLVLDAKVDYEETDLLKSVEDYSDYKETVKGKFFPGQITESVENLIEGLRNPNK